MTIVSNEMINLIFDHGYKTFPNIMRLSEIILANDSSFEPDLYTVLLYSYLGTNKSKC